MDIRNPEHLKELITTGKLEDKIFLSSRGRWFIGDTAVEDKETSDFLSRSICRISEDSYAINHGDRFYPVTVEDVPVFVTDIRFEGFASFERAFIRLEGGDEEELRAETLFYRDNNLYCTVIKDGMTARFFRSPAVRILDRLTELNGEYSVNLCGKKIVLKREE
jgi:hypothetical protein